MAAHFSTTMQFVPPKPSIVETPSPVTKKSRVQAIVVEHLTKEFKLGAEPAHTLKERLLASRSGPKSGFRALDGIEFDVAIGESFGILGHNGSGKSTLLKIMAGTYQASTGSVKVRGRLAALLELGAGFHPELTGRENIYLNGSILGFSRSRIDDLFDEIVDFAEIREFIDVQVKLYSSGMTARLGFAVATHLDPDILLVDEVLAVGDEAFQTKCMERVRRFRRMGRTFVLVSHNAENIRELCDRALVLHRGRMLHVGDVDTAIEVYREALHGPAESSSPRSEPREQHETQPAVSLLGAHIEADSPTATVGPPVFAPGASIEVAVAFRVNQSCDFRIRLVMRTEDNAILMNASTNEVLGGPITADGEGDARFTLRNVPLLDGKYWLTVAVESVDGNVTHDRIHRLGEFVIKGPGAGYGRVQIDVGCEIQTGRTSTVHESATAADSASAGRPRILSR